MLKAKTHYDPIPLSVVKKIIGEEFQPEKKAGRPRSAKKQKLKLGLVAANALRGAGGK